MKKCPICGRDVLGKRKDAKYCKDAACRKKAHNDRKEEAARIEPRAGALKASVVVTFPDGSRWLMELTPLNAVDEARLPSLSQVTASEPEIGSRSVPALPTGQLAAAVSSSTPGMAPGISSDQIPQAVAVGLLAPLSSLEQATVRVSQPERSASPAAVAPAYTDSSAAASPLARTELRTVELFFTDDRDRRISFTDAVRGRGPDGWRVRRYARVALGFSRSDGYGLGGKPGSWREHYLGRSPAEFGLDADLGVLYMDDADGRAYVAGVELLRAALGDEWRLRLRNGAVIK